MNSPDIGPWCCGSCLIGSLFSALDDCCHWSAQFPCSISLLIYLICKPDPWCDQSCHGVRSPAGLFCGVAFRNDCLFQISCPAVLHGDILFFLHMPWILSISCVLRITCIMYLFDEILQFPDLCMFMLNVSVFAFLVFTNLANYFHYHCRKNNLYKHFLSFFLKVQKKRQFFCPAVIPLFFHDFSVLSLICHTVHQPNMHPSANPFDQVFQAVRVPAVYPSDHGSCLT